MTIAPHSEPSGRLGTGSDAQRARRPTSRPSQRTRGDVTLNLLGGFQLSCSSGVTGTPLSAQRVLAILALSGRAVRRSYVAGNLWSEASETRAAGSLRSALWRIRQIHPHLVNVDAGCIRIDPAVTVDVQVLEQRARRLVAGEANAEEVTVPDLSGELLPDWYEDWVVLERERLRQLGMHALEALARALSAAGRHGEAVEAAMTAIKSEVLRESAHRVLIEVHVAEANVSEALRHYDLYRSILRRDLGLEPSVALTTLVESLTA